MRHGILSLILLVTAAIVATGQARSGGAQQAVVDLDAAPTLRLVQELRIGSASDPTIGFARVGSVDIDREGQLYVFESQDRHIRVYSTGGRLVRTIGRAGNGPGEFAASIRFGVKGDTVWSVDGNGVQTDIALFDRRTGALLSTARSDGARVPGRGRSNLIFSPHAMRPDGMFVSLSYISSTMRGAPATGISSQDPLRLPRILFGADGNVRDTLSWYIDPPSPDQPPRASITSAANNRHVVPGAPADRDMSLVFADGRFLVENRRPGIASQGTMRVTREDIRGTNVYSRSYRFTPVRYNDQILDSIAARSLRSSGLIIIDGAIQTKNADTTTQTRTQLRAAMHFPDFQQPLQAAFIGDDASILLRREEAIGTQRWDLLDPQGNPRGKFVVPANVRPLWLRGDTLWVAIPDADDVPFLVKYRISR